MDQSEQISFGLPLTNEPSQLEESFLSYDFLFDDGKGNSDIWMGTRQDTVSSGGSDDVASATFDQCDMNGVDPRPGPYFPQQCPQAAVPGPVADVKGKNGDSLPGMEFYPECKHKSQPPPFVCRDCHPEKPFTLKHNLYRHEVEFGHGGRPKREKRKCPECKQKFSRSDSLNNHRRTRHGVGEN